MNTIYKNQIQDDFHFTAIPILYHRFKRKQESEQSAFNYLYSARSHFIKLEHQWGEYYVRRYTLLFQAFKCYLVRSISGLRRVEEKTDNYIQDARNEGFLRPKDVMLKVKVIAKIGRLFEKATNKTSAETEYLRAIQQCDMVIKLYPLYVKAKNYRQKLLKWLYRVQYVKAA